MNKFTAFYSGAYDANWQRVDAWGIKQYQGSGTSSVVESNERWFKKEEAEAAAERANAGNEEGLTFALYSDD
jgi:hypothetical protein